MRAIRSHRHRRQVRRKIVAIYDYRDVTGALIYQIVRYKPKRFRVRRPHPEKSAKWVGNLDGVELMLYRLPELLAAIPHKRVYIVEGEKDVDNLYRLGCVATTSPLGGLSWRSKYAWWLCGTDVIILPDNDDVGRRYAQQVAESLKDKAASVRVLELPNLPPKGDVSDWIEAGGTRDQLINM